MYAYVHVCACDRVSGVCACVHVRMCMCACGRVCVRMRFVAYVHVRVIEYRAYVDPVCVVDPWTPLCVCARGVDPVWTPCVDPSWTPCVDPVWTLCRLY